VLVSSGSSWFSSNREREREREREKWASREKEECGETRVFLVNVVL
jgi:hypothetical protein